MTETILGILRDVRPEHEFRDIDNFFDRGMLDSFDLTMLVTALEERFGIAISGVEIVPENFQNIPAIVSLLSKYEIAAKQDLAPTPADCDGRS